jgi:hypothetical protein
LSPLRLRPMALGPDFAADADTETRRAAIDGRSSVALQQLVASVGWERLFGTGQAIKRKVPLEVPQRSEAPLGILTGTTHLRRRVRSYARQASPPALRRPVGLRGLRPAAARPRPHRRPPAPQCYRRCPGDISAAGTGSHKTGNTERPMRGWLTACMAAPAECLPHEPRIKSASRSLNCQPRRRTLCPREGCSMR